MRPFLMETEYAVFGYLANAFWQVPLVFAAAWCAARLTRRNGAALEHRIWVGAMLLEAAIPAFRLDASRLWREVLAVFLPARGTDGGSIRIATATGATHGSDGLRVPEDVLFGVAVAFAAWAIYYAARLGWGVWRTGVMRNQACPASLEGDATQTWQRLAADFIRRGRRMPEFSSSPAVAGPVTMGLLRPAVLVPPGFLERLRPEDLDAVLAHELAHVLRRDFAKNLLYEAASLAVAWHPALWLTRARLAESREMVCDAMAADAVAGRESYARSLLRLASMIANGAPARTLHAIGIFDANSFERRVMNLTKKRVEMQTVQRIGIAAACAVAAMATCATALALRVEIGPQANAVSAKDDNRTTANPKVDVVTMKSTSQTMPVYPREAKANHDTVDGPVVLAVTIGKDGAVESIHVEKSLRADYDQSALDAVRTWRWEPYLLNGEPTEVDTAVTVIYSGPHGDK